MGPRPLSVIKTFFSIRKVTWDLGQRPLLRIEGVSAIEVFFLYTKHARVSWDQVSCPL